MQGRRKARSLALQALYEIDCAEHPVEDVIGARLDTEALSNRDRRFVRDLVVGVARHREKLDTLIHQYAPEWPVSQMAIIDRNILRMAIYELAISQGTPLKVVINEAVELGKMYGSDSTPRFINGVLGTLVSHYNELMDMFAEERQSASEDSSDQT